MVHALVNALGAANVRTSTSVDGSPAAVRSTFTISTGESIEARAVVLATPAYATSELTRDRDEELSRLAGEIAYASAATVALAFARTQVRHPLTGSGFVVPACRAHGHSGGVLAVLEVAEPRARGSRAACGRSLAALAILEPSIEATPSWFSYR